MEPHRHVRRPVPPRIVFIVRLGRKATVAGGVVAASLLLGACGYHYAEGLSWLDATLNASMILTGMGPVDQLHSDGGKLFAIFYSLFSGVVFITMAALLFGPVLHRFLHRLHLELETDPEADISSGESSQSAKKPHHELHGQDTDCTNENPKPLR